MKVRRRREPKPMGWIIFGISLGVIGAILASIPGLYSFKHPELTQMQLFYEFWPSTITGIVLLLGGSVIATIGEKSRRSR